MRAITPNRRTGSCMSKTPLLLLAAARFVASAEGLFASVRRLCASCSDKVQRNFRTPSDLVERIETMSHSYWNCSRSSFIVKMRIPLPLTDLLESSLLFTRLMLTFLTYIATHLSH